MIHASEIDAPVETCDPDEIDEHFEADRIAESEARLRETKPSRTTFEPLRWVLNPTIQPIVEPVIDEEYEAAMEAETERQRIEWELERAAEQRGAQERWDRLTLEEKSYSWEDFHSLCEQGIGDEHPFYHLLMSEWLRDYSGD